MNAEIKFKQVLVEVSCTIQSVVEFVNERGVNLSRNSLRSWIDPDGPRTFKDIEWCMIICSISFGRKDHSIKDFGSFLMSIDFLGKIAAEDVDGFKELYSWANGSSKHMSTSCTSRCSYYIKELLARPK
jgi:hypothetical protein